MLNIIMSRPIIQKKGKTITRYSTASQRDCSRVFVISAYSIQDFCPPAIPATCGNYSDNTVLDGGSPNNTSECILDGGSPFDQGRPILDGGQLGTVCKTITNNDILDGNREDSSCTVDGGDPSSTVTQVFDGGDL
jgi:hypothetical protein